MARGREPGVNSRNLTWPRTSKEVMSKGTKGPAPRWCPRGLSKAHRHRLQKMRQKEIVEQMEQSEWDRWFNQARPVITAKHTWGEKHLPREENGDSSDNAYEDKEENGEQAKEVNKGIGEK
jgi:hypothetical protein